MSVVEPHPKEEAMLAGSSPKQEKVPATCLPLTPTAACSPSTPIAKRSPSSPMVGYVGSMEIETPSPLPHVGVWSGRPLRSPRTPPRWKKPLTRLAPRKLTCHHLGFEQDGHQATSAQSLYTLRRVQLPTSDELAWPTAKQLLEWAIAADLSVGELQAELLEVGLTSGATRKSELLDILRAIGDSPNWGMDPFMTELEVDTARAVEVDSQSGTDSDDDMGILPRNLWPSN